MMATSEKKRVVFVTDHLFEERGYGGQEVTQKELAARAPDGITVEFVSIDSLGPPQKNEDGTADMMGFTAAVKNRTDNADLVVFTNIARWPREPITAITEDAPYVKMEFDYGFCKTHLKNCEDGCKSCVEDGWYKEFLQGAERIFFTCPAQKDWYRRILGSVADNSILNPSWIDESKFPHLGWPRTPGTVMYHGRLFPHKGVLDMASNAMQDQGRQYTFVGDGPPEIEAIIESVRNCRIIRRVSPPLIPYLLNATEFWMMFSGWDDTGPMSAIEAYLCGAKIIHNGRLGYLGYPWDWKNHESVRAELRKIPGRFWDEISSILDG